MCVVCGAPEVDLHHLDYDHLGRERLEDLLAMCDVHHEALHAAWDANPHWRRLGRRAGSLGLVASLRRWSVRSGSEVRDSVNPVR